MEKKNKIKDLESLNKEIERLDRAVFESKILIREDIKGFPGSIFKKINESVKSSFWQKITSFFTGKP